MNLFVQPSVYASPYISTFPPHLHAVSLIQFTATVFGVTTSLLVHYFWNDKHHAQHKTGETSSNTVF